MKRVNHSLQLGAILSVVAVILSTAGPLQAQDTWNGESVTLSTPSGNWSDGFNWVSTVAPVSGDSLVFAVPTGTGTRITVNDFAADALTVNGITVNGGAFTLGGDEILLNGNLANNAGTTTVSMNMVLQQNSDWTLGSVMILNNTISGNYGFTKDGSSMLRVGATGFLAYTGDTIINSGTIDMLNNAGMPSGSGKGNLIANGDFNLNNVAISINGLSGSGTISKNGSGGRTLTLGNNDANGNFTGTFMKNSGTLSLIKTGAGTQILGGTMNMGAGGTITVNGGALLINGTETSGGTLTAASGGTLGGNGSITVATGGLKVVSGGTLSPGAALGTAGLLSLSGGLTLQSGGTYAVDLFGTGQGTTYDATLVNLGAISLGSSTLALNLGYVPNPGDSFDILANTTGSAITGTFNGLAEGSQIVIGSTDLSITYLGGTGHDVVLTVVPEPSTLTLAGLGLLGACLLKRRVRK